MYKIFDTPKESDDIVNKLYVDTVVGLLLAEIERLNKRLDEFINVIKVDFIELHGPTLITLNNDIKVTSIKINGPNSITLNNDIKITSIKINGSNLISLKK